MKLPIPGTLHVYINDNCVLIGENDRRLDIPVYPDENFGKVDLFFHGKLQRLSLLWLYLYAKFEIPSFVDIKHVRFFEVPKYITGFGWKVIFTKPYWYDKTHRVVPMFPTMAVDSKGECIKILTGKVCHTWKENYWILSGYSPIKGIYMPLKLHVLVANAWVLKNQDSSHPMCNHKDGNKFNPDARNLEWVSPSGNNLHAVNSGLLPEAKVCKLRNKDTGEVLEFQSIKRAAAFLHCNPERLYRSVLRLNRLINDIYEFRSPDDDRPWLYAKGNRVMNQEGSRYIIKVYDDPHEVKIFNGWGFFSKYYNLFPRGYVCKEEDSLRKFKQKYPEIKIEVIDQQSSAIGIQLRNVETKEIIDFQTIREAANYLGVDPRDIRYAFGTQGRFPYKQWQIRQKTDEDWPEPKVRFSAKPLRVTDKATGITTEYPSLTSAELALKIYAVKLKRMSRNPQPTDTHLVEFISDESSETSRRT